MTVTEAFAYINLGIAVLNFAFMYVGARNLAMMRKRNEQEWDYMRRFTKAGN